MATMARQNQEYEFLFAEMEAFLELHHNGTQLCRSLCGSCQTHF